MWRQASLPDVEGGHPCRPEKSLVRFVPCKHLNAPRYACGFFRRAGKPGSTAGRDARRHVAQAPTACSHFQLVSTNMSRRRRWGWYSHVVVCLGFTPYVRAIPPAGAAGSRNGTGTGARVCDPQQLSPAQRTQKYQNVSPFGHCCGSQSRAPFALGGRSGGDVFATKLLASAK